ncbi:hypothetical protein [Serratia fonticola]|uniref:hypothetical protein n=1 Tax=Serratia fonticola TaxID=47917 RepID=UPI00301D8016
MDKPFDIKDQLQRLQNVKAICTNIMNSSEEHADSAMSILDEISIVFDDLFTLNRRLVSLGIDTSPAHSPKNQRNNLIAQGAEFYHQIHQYLPHQTASGMKVYKMKESKQPGEESVYACPCCIYDEKISLLHPVDTHGEHFNLRCMCCGTTFSGDRTRYEFTRAPKNDGAF